MNYKHKYLKYKLKYLKAKKLYGGMEDHSMQVCDEEDSKNDEQDKGNIKPDVPEPDLSVPGVLEVGRRARANVVHPDELALTIARMSLSSPLLMGSPVGMDIVTPEQTKEHLKRKAEDISNIQVGRKNPYEAHRDSRGNNMELRPVTPVEEDVVDGDEKKCSGDE